MHMYFLILFSSWQSDVDLPGLLQSAQFCLFSVAVLAYSEYSKLIKSSFFMNLQLYHKDLIILSNKHKH